MQHCQVVGSSLVVDSRGELTFLTVENLIIKYTSQSDEIQGDPKVSTFSNMYKSSLENWKKLHMKIKVNFSFFY